MNHLNERELATVLHAIRKTQEAISKGTDLSECLHFVTEGIKPLTVDEIDGLCERLNTAPKTKLYRVTVTRVPLGTRVTQIVVRAARPLGAKKVAADVLDEMWPGGHRYSKMSGVQVELAVEELVEPNGVGYCYPPQRAPRMFKHRIA